MSEDDSVILAFDVQLFDEQSLQSLLELSNENFNELLGVFKSEIVVLMAKLKKAVENLDIKEINYLSHTLAGISSTMAAKRLSALCRKLMVATKVCKKKELSALVEEIIQVSAATMANLDNCASYQQRC